MKPALTFTKIMLITILLGAFTFNIKPSKAGTIIVPDDHPTIQEAVNHANPGDLILVKSGTYYEHIEINKTIMLVGENSINTIIDGSAERYIPVVMITKPHVRVINFTIRNTSPEPETYGVLISNTKNVTLRKNMIKETYRGIVIHNSSQCKILENLIAKNYAYGTSLRPSSNFNLFINNTFMANPTGVTLDPLCQNNTFYHNYFINNTNQVETFEPKNQWDNGYPPPTGGGNYWSDYIGVDVKSGPNQDLPGSDGIGDTTYTRFGVKDNYPLMRPYIPIPPVANFTYSPTNPIKGEEITFNASLSYDSDGNITSYEWNFGDGNTTTVQDPIIKHSYADYGDYTVELKVKDNDNLTDKAISLITIRKMASFLSIEAHPKKIEIGRNAIINGTLHPPKEANITINYKLINEDTWKSFTAPSNPQGVYQYQWTPAKIGVYELKSSWNGDEHTYPSNSSTITLNVTKKSSTLTIDANPKKVAVGSNITITGKLAPTKKGESITISYLPIGKSWMTLATAKTDSNGNYLYNWKTTQKGSGVLNASWLGDEETYGSQNLIGLIYISEINSNITIDVEPKTAVIGSNITISGKLTPIRENASIKIQIRKLNTTDVWDETVQTNATSSYTHVWKPSSAGTYEIQASWQGDMYAIGVESKKITVTIKPENPIHSTIYLVGILIVLTVIVAVIFKKRKK